ERPVTLPPGRERLLTNPLPTGSTARAKTIGMVDVACLTAEIALPPVTMTSTLELTNSVAISAKRSGRPSANRYSKAMVRPSIQPSSRKRSTRAAYHWPLLARVPGASMPMSGRFAGCCARATSGHAAADSAITLMKSRRRITAPKAQEHADSGGLQEGFTTDKMGFRGQFAMQRSWPADVRFGSKADIRACPGDVRYSPQKRTLGLSRAMSALCQKQTLERLLNYLIGSC